MAFRFVHTADLHLDSPLRSLALRAPEAAQALGLATRTALTRIVDLCLDERVDALLIAGDLYDGDQTSMKTARFLAHELGRLDKAGVRTCLIRGNHDALSKVTKELELPPSVHVFGGHATTLRWDLRGRDIAIHGLSFARSHAPDSLLGRYPAPQPGALNVGMLHTSLGGVVGHDVYAPCSLAELRATGYDYWALGHIHQRAEYPGRPHVVMPGNPQGRDIGEAGPRSVTLVEMAADGTVRTQLRETMAVEFLRVPVPVAGLADWAGLVQALRGAVRAARRDRAAESLILRPMLAGACPLHWRLRRDTDLLLTEAEDAASALGSVWIDKIEVAVTGPEAPGDGPMAEIAALLAPDGVPSHTARTRADEALEALARALPPALRGLFDAQGEPDAALRDALLTEGALDLLSMLDSGSDSGAG